MTSAVLAWVALVWALAGSGALATAAIRARRARRGAVAPAGTAAIEALLVRPCAGHELGLEERLFSVARARASFRPRVRVAIQEPTDGAAAAARAACARLRAVGWDAEVLVTSARGTPSLQANSLANRKVAQIASAVAAEPAELVLWADSDVDLTDTDLDALAAPLVRDEAVAAVWVPVVERGPAVTPADRVSEAILGGSLHAFPVLAHLDPQGMVGKLVAIRSAALQEARFATMGDVLGEDMELARRLRAAGRRVVVAPIVGVARPRGRSLSDVLARYARWIAMVRAQRPARLAGYPLLLAATPLVLGLSLVAFAAGALPAIPALAAVVAVATRLAAAGLAARLAGRTRSVAARVADVVLADLGLLLAFARALGPRRVSWRGRLLRVGHGGHVEDVRAVQRGATRPGPGLAAAAIILCFALGGTADALPRPGTTAPRARVHDVAGRAVRLDRLRGKPVLIVYESRESSEQNQALKDRLSRLARGGRYRSRVHLLPVASVEAFDYFPIRGLVESSIAAESERIGTAIYCDWDGSFRRALTLSPERSSVVLVARDGRVIFAYEGALTRRAQDRLVELLTRETEDAAGGAPRQEALRERPEPPDARLVPQPEGGDVPGPQGRIDGVQLRGDGVLLRGAPGLDVARPDRGRADRQPQIRSLTRAELIAEPDRHRQGALRHARDGRRAGLEREWALGDGALAALREDPDDAAGRREQARGVTDRAGPIRAIVEIDSEGTHVREERQAAQVPGVHQGVGIDLQDARAQNDGHEGVPPRRVIRHDQNRPSSGRLAQDLETTHAHGPESGAQARLRVTGEPASQEAGLAGRDHPASGWARPC